VGGFRRLNERGKSCCVVGGHVRQNFAIQFDARLFEPSDEFAVRDFRCPAGSADPDDPEGPEIALLSPPSDEPITQRLLDSLLGGPIQFALREKVARRPGERLVTIGSSFCSSFYSRHVSTPVMIEPAIKVRAGTYSLDR
jgi:hypothetical protein